MHDPRHSQVLPVPIVLLFACVALPANPACCRADDVQILDRGNEALGARIDLIRSARCSIDAAYLQIADDPTSRCLLEHLRAAARQGVRVRLLVDACYNTLRAATIEQLTADGVELQEFHPPRWTRLHWSAYRLHDKLLVVDSQSMILGGRNMSREYFAATSPEGFRDRDVLVTGPPAEHAHAYFLSLWGSGHVRPVQSPSEAGWHRCCRRLFEPPNLLKYCRALADLRVPAINAQACAGLNGFSGCDAYARATPALPTGPSPVFTVAPGSVRFVHSHQVVGCPRCDITDEMLNLVRSAQSCIVIETPYLVVSKKFRCALAAAAARGVEVHLVTNSAATTNQIFAQAGYANQKRRLLKLGVHLWEYQGPGCLHAKCWVVDDYAVIGSYNLDPRSDCYDTQTCVVIRDPDAAAALLTCILHDMEHHSLPVAADGKMAPGRSKPTFRKLLRPAIVHALRPAALLLQRQL